MKGISEFWVADTAENFIKSQYACNGNPNSTIKLENPQGFNISVNNNVLQTLEIDRILYFKCKGRKKNKVIILEITETLMANMLNPGWQELPEAYLYEQEKELFRQKMEQEGTPFSEKVFKSYFRRYAFPK